MTTTTIAVPASCAPLCTTLAELVQRIDDDLAQAGNGAAIDYGGEVRGLCRGLARDVTAMRGQRPDLKVAYLADGASEFETLYRREPGGVWIQYCDSLAAVIHGSARQSRGFGPPKLFCVRAQCRGRMGPWARSSFPGVGPVWPSRCAR